jgi:hypothetical protein
MIKKTVFSVFFLTAAFLAGISPALAAETTVRTDSATNIEEREATLRGFIDTNDDEDVYVWFEWDTRSTQLRNYTDPIFYDSTSGDEFDAKIRNLQPNTTYYFRVIAENDDGDIIRGDTKSFKTDRDGNNDDDDDDQQNPCNIYYPCNPYYYPPDYYNYYQPLGPQARVVTIAATIPNNSYNSAILNGYADPAGDNVVRWFEWGTNQNYLPESTMHSSHGGTPGTFSQLVTGLQPNVTYYFRAVVQGRTGPVYGQTLAFVPRGYAPQPIIYPPQTTPITVPVTPTVTNIPTITIPVKITPVVDTTKTPTPDEEEVEVEVPVPTPEEEVEVEGEVLSGAAIFGGTFFPNTLIGWTFLILLIVILVYVAQRAFRPSVGHSHTLTTHHHSAGHRSTGHEF